MFWEQLPVVVQALGYITGLLILAGAGLAIITPQEKSDITESPAWDRYCEQVIKESNKK